MWDKPRELNSLTSALLGTSFALMLYGAMHYALRLPEFGLRVVQLSAAPVRVDAGQIESVVRNELRGNFFTADMEGLQHAFEKLPWVRKASIRRYFPWRLVVSLEEHVALARWNGTELVNIHGEIFSARTNQILPGFAGQPDSAAEVTQMYRAFAEQLAPLNQEIVQVELSPRRAWQVRLSNGLLLKLGREQVQHRLERFVGAYFRIQDNSAAQYVDLRYRNGFAVMYRSRGEI